ncbi:hypothetical protein CDES_01175 [Corynebacterium deserti GIMN1.010]|uniref:DUF559 domain-containing protein n=1 Tax=Corynebacterium deserti GIMN1.010 TaxID=931089 RepID=A0A0M4CHI6_9CORY|nr:type IV toxin-antitoxin system AbiEi family antitoxin domain-containing protein [Corynebacterium deserti]ALC04714.1 hypothetical protein CDES_01175 [Corynebacterium deserti GIMN1.010]
MGINQIATNRRVWTAKELREYGYSKRTIARSVKVGAWFRILRGVYSTDPPSGRVVWEAVKLLRPYALLDGKSAMEAYNEEELSLPLRVRVDTSNLLRASRDVVVAKRSTRMRAERVGDYRLVTAVDAVVTCLEDGEIERWKLREFVEVQYGSKRGLAKLRKDLRKLKTSRQAGVKGLLEMCVVGTDSSLERKLVGQLRQAGFATRQNVSVGGYSWDVEVVGVGLIDVDSRKYHRAQDRNFIVDRWKNNQAVAMGYVALRVTDECVDFAMREIVKLLRQVQDYRKHNPRKPVKVEGVAPVYQWHNSLLSVDNAPI